MCLSSPQLLNTVGLNLWSATLLLDPSVEVLTGMQFALDWFKWRDSNKMATMEVRTGLRKQTRTGSTRTGGRREGCSRALWMWAPWGAPARSYGSWSKAATCRNLVTSPLPTLWSLEAAKVSSQGSCAVLSARLSLTVTEQGSEEQWRIAGGDRQDSQCTGAACFLICKTG